MATIKVQTIDTTANEEASVNFDVKGLEFLVTNTSGDNIRVTLGEEYSSENSVIVPADSSRIVTVAKVHSLSHATSSISIMPVETSSQGVEIQCILW